MTLCIGGPAHGQEVDFGDRHAIEWPVPNRDFGSDRLGTVTYTRRRLMAVSHDRRTGWTRGVFAWDGMTTDEAETALRSLLLGRFIREGVRVDL